MANQISGLLSPFLRRRRMVAAIPFVRGRVLDYGCNTAALAQMVSFTSYVGVDIDPAPLAQARQRFPHAHFIEGGEAALEQLNKSEPFDTIVSLAVIEHVSDAGALLRAFARLLAPHGRVVLTTPHPAYDRLHAIGSRFRLFSSEAREDHEHLLDRAALAHHAQAAGLQLRHYQRFLLGANQLAVLGWDRA